MVSQLSFKQKMVFFCVFCFSLGVIGFFSYQLIFRQEKIYYIHFDCSVNGLKEGSAVTYKGVEVGLVSGITIDDSNFDLIKVAVKLKKNFPVYSNYVASLSFKGFSGFFSIDLNKEASNNSIEMAPGSFITYRISTFDTILQSAPEVIQETKIFLKKMNSCFTEQQIKNIGDSLETLAMNLKECSEDFKNISKHGKKEAALIFKRLNQSLLTFTKITKKIDKDYSKIQTEVINKFCDISDIFKKLTTKVSDKANARVGAWRFFC
ncbi:MlaD family protein [Alphaproteobacteria bacterium endosymbiont of Tiliacea citrago]|uniref:MlaD family protein n=1 Tax=Alphaproteobacteria bacterium endosymbiont of Tiliacea citrago TaxID=3077944 RepID=UPI00313E5A16